MTTTNPFDTFLSAPNGSEERLVAEKEIAHLWQQLVLNQFQASEILEKTLLGAELLVSTIGKRFKYGSLWTDKLIRTCLSAVAVKMTVERHEQFGIAFHDQPGELIVNCVIQMTQKLAAYVAKLELKY